MLVARCTNPREMLSKGVVGWHRHQHPTLSIVKRGSYVEHVLRGQYFLVRGLAVLSRPFTLHRDEIDGGGAKVLNWSVADGNSMHGVFELPRAACRPEWPRDPRDVSEMLVELKPVPIRRNAIWIDEALDVLLRVQESTAASRALGVSREHFHRSFSKALKLTPAQVLREHKISSALHHLRAGEPIALVAAKCGFADQSHMTRLVRLVTGFAPAQFQKSQITAVQDTPFPAAAN
jgi:AraC family transcriptional regulator